MSEREHLYELFWKCIYDLEVMIYLRSTLQTKI